VKINTVVQRGVNDSGVPELVARFRHTGVIVRFIEYMDVGNRNGWERADVVTSRELMTQIDAFWPLEPVLPGYRGEVAARYRYADGGGEIGFISSVSAPFCGDCSRARLSSEGQLFTCLFATKGTDLRTILRDPDPAGDDESLRRALERVWHRRADRYSEERAEQRSGAATFKDGRAAEKIEMHYIGG
jgi:GTP 3',8-cyclase